MIKIYRKIALLTVLIMLFVIAPEIPELKVDAATVNESESNNSSTTADITQDDNTNYGSISSGADEDWWKITFSSSGMANFWLGNIPSGCNYVMHLKTGGDALGTIAYNETSSGNQKLIRANVKAGTTYYLQIYSLSGYSSAKYTMRIKRYSYRAARIFTSTSSGNNNRPSATNSLPYIRNMGFTSGGECYHFNATQTYNAIPSSDIAVLRGHGNGTGGIFFCYDASGTQTSIYATDSTGTRTAISNYEYAALNDVDLIIFAACNTGHTNSSYGNLVDSALSKDAFCAIGWKEAIYTPSANAWIEQFFKRASERGMVLGALEWADRWSEVNNPSYAQYMRNRYTGTSNFTALYFAG